MDFMEMYAQKKMTAEQAASLVKSGDWVDYGWCVNTPVAVDAALAKRLPELENVNFRGGILMWVPEIFQIDDPAAHMTWNSWHMGGIERKAIAQGFSFYSPIRYSELPRYYRESPDPLDIAVFQVTPMDEHGYFNFGPSTSHLGAVCEKARKIIVEVNTNMPRCLGGMENCVHVSQVTGIVEGDNPPIGQMAAAGPASEVDLKVANLVVPQIPDGACLQLGIGGMPNAIGSLIAQSDLKDLGVHTEMYVDAFVDIAKAGKITGAHKQLDKGRQVYAFGAGTQKMYDYLNNNPECMSAPVDYTNDIRSISALDNFISINNAVDIDLFGRRMRRAPASSTFPVQAASWTSCWAHTFPRAARASSACPLPSLIRRPVSSRAASVPRWKTAASSPIPAPICITSARNTAASTSRV